MATDYFNILRRNSSFLNDCVSLYGLTTDEITARYATLLSEYEEQFGKMGEFFFSSPGRIELVGNHTDHNGGKVLAAAVSIDIAAVVSPSTDGIIRIWKDGFMVEVDTNKETKPDIEIKGPWALVMGVVDYFRKAGMQVGGFTAAMHTTIPLGAGVSSSSAYELMSAEILNTFYNSRNLGVTFKALASQYSENNYLFKPSGLMDQLTISAGGVSLMDFQKLTEPTIESTTWEFKNLDIFVIATGGDHSNLTDDYAAIKSEMNAVAKFFGKDILREVDPNEFAAKKEELKGVVSERAINRAEHFFEENVRVDEAFRAVKKKDEKAFLACINASGNSSRYKLQNCYSEKAGNHNIENGLDAVAKIKGVVAYRVHGGGFAGTILVFVKKNHSEDAQEKFNEIFGEESVFKVAIRKPGATCVAKIS